MSKTIQHQIVSGVLAIFADDNNWTRGALARTRNGDACSWEDPKAVKYCALGAMIRVATDLVSDYDQARFLVIQVTRQILAASNRSGSVLPHINDVEGHAAIVSMFKKALV